MGDLPTNPFLFPALAAGLGLVILALWGLRQERTWRKLMALYRGYVEGELDDARLEAMQHLPAPRWAKLHVLNIAVVLEVAAGRYVEALAWRGRWAGASRNDELLRINEAEALACLGRHAESLAWPRPSSNAFIKAGLAGHRAWVFAELGRVDEARAALKTGRGSDLNGLYRAEWHFAEAMVELAAGDAVASRAALERARRLLVRASSRRNFEFLLARVALLEGNSALALEHFERGGAMPYRRQGGPALLQWGDTLAGLGRREEALPVWQRCTLEDPQSPAAATARERLAALDTAATP